MKVKTVILTLGITLIVLGLIPNSKNSVNPSQNKETEQVIDQKEVKKVQELSKVQKHHLGTITSNYKVSVDLVKEVLVHVDKYSHSVFPRREDLLAIIGIESGWRPYVYSPLKTDPAFGLTQIRPIAWKKMIPHPDDLLDIENQIKYAAKILRYNFKLTDNPDAAIIAYNVGYGAWLNGEYTIDYLAKFVAEREKFKRI